VCDLVDLANWLGKVLKNHCAPMRDGLVNKMCKSITKGVQQADQKLMISGVRRLLNLLEAMKLDVANHQIGHMRPLTLVSPAPVTRAIFDPGHKFVPKVATTASVCKGMPASLACPDPESDPLNRSQTGSFENALPLISPSED
jgi:hypothetical protein